MTVSYTADVANASLFGCFTKILRRWKGSVYKLIYKELAAYLCCYFLLNITYRTVLCSEGYELYRRWFESIKAYCTIQMSSIPMTFGLGFYVSLIVKRWWDQYMVLPWPDSLAMFVAGLLHGQDDKGRMMRRNIMRYTLLSYVITLRRISFRVRKRFPTMDHIIDAGLMRSDELKCMELLDEKCSVSKWWMPLVWATNIIDQANEEKRIQSPPALMGVMNELTKFRQGLTDVQHYDTISVPLVYTQVVTWSIYSYFLAALMGAQWVRPENPNDFETTYKLPSFSEVTLNDTISEAFSEEGNKARYQALDLYFPFFLTLQFMFYVGWMKVAETLINPFGEDDDDFELNYLIDRHVQVAYMIVDDMHHTYPELLKDMYWNESKPIKLPYTEETQHYRQEEPKGSAEQREEEDNNYQTYYSILRNRLGGSTKALEAEHYSDYEAIDTSSIFGKFRARLRKSQIRKSSRSSTSSGAYFKTKLSVANSGEDIVGRQRKNTAIDSPSLDTSAESGDAFKGYDIILSSSPTSTTTTITNINGGNAMQDRPRQLSTIAESLHSTLSTPTDSRRGSSQAYPRVDRIFEGLDKTAVIPTSVSNLSMKSGIFMGASDSDSQYYPLGSEGSGRIETRKFSSEDAPANSYETIHFGKVKPVNPAIAELANSAIMLGVSPRLPKRQARMALKALNLSSANLKDDFEKAMENSSELNVVQEENSKVVSPNEDDEEFETIEPPCEDSPAPFSNIPKVIITNGSCNSSTTDETCSVSDKQNLIKPDENRKQHLFYDDCQETNSAFDNATFYV